MTKIEKTIGRRISEKTLAEFRPVLNWWPNVEVFSITRRNGSMYIYGWDEEAMPTAQSFDAFIRNELYEKLKR